MPPLLCASLVSENTEMKVNAPIIMSRSSERLRAIMDGQLELFGEVIAVHPVKGSKKTGLMEVYFKENSTMRRCNTVRPTQSRK